MHLKKKSMTIFISIVKSRNYSCICPRDSRAWQRYVCCTFFPRLLCWHLYYLGSHTVLCSHSKRLTLSEGTKRWHLQAMAYVYTYTLTWVSWDSRVMHAQRICDLSVADTCFKDIHTLHLLTHKLRDRLKSPWLYWSRRTWKESCLSLPI